MPGLRSQEVGEQYATVLNIGSYLQQTPFPLFVNTVAIRLAETFRDGCVLNNFFHRSILKIGKKTSESCFIHKKFRFIVISLHMFTHFSSNQLRYYIVKAFSECEHELSKVFSDDELARRILKVSHSNDPTARALTLQLLGAISPILRDNKMVCRYYFRSQDNYLEIPATITIEL